MTNSETIEGGILESESDTYNRLLPELLASEGKFAVIAGDKLIGVFDTRGDALTCGYAVVGLTTPFLVQQIWAIEPVVRLREIEWA
jgi:hypothetical protein